MRDEGRPNRPTDCAPGGDNRAPGPTFRAAWRLFFLPLASFILSPGPVFFYDLVRSSRRHHYILFRCLYACLLLVILCWFHLNWSSPQATASGWFDERHVPVDEMPRFANQFFLTFLSTQLAVVLLLAPLYTAGCIAEEKERGTLDFLLASNLASHEIVLGKLAGRLLNLVLLVLTGLPILALTQLWGGVDPQLIVAGFAATAATMLSVGSLSVLNSVCNRKPLQALLWTYLEIAFFLLVGACIPGVNGGHPVVALRMLQTSWPVNGKHSLSPMDLIAADYLFVHLALAAICTWLAVCWLRPVIQGPPASQPVRTPSGRVLLPRPLVVAPLPPEAPPWRPPVGERALLWKEMYVEPAFRWSQLHPLFLLLFLLVGVFVVAVGLSLTQVEWLNKGHQREVVNLGVQLVGTPLACVILLTQAFYAAGTVSRERQRHTLDSLLALPQDRRTILWTKWLGSILSVRQTWWGLAAIWTWGAVSGGLHLLGLVLMLLAFAVYTAFVSSLGMYCSTVCRSTLRATLWAVLTLLVLGGAPHLLWWGRYQGHLATLLPSFVYALLYDGLTPPMPLLVFAVRPDEPLFSGELGISEPILAALLGLAVYAGVSWVLWRLALRRFRI